MILSAAVMLERMNWFEPANMIIKGMEGAIAAKMFTYDLECQMVGAMKVGTSGFADAIVGRM